LKGELTLKQCGVRSAESGVTKPQFPTPNPQTEAEACFLKALEVSRQQQARSLELRAAMSLARLWRDQGKTEEARDILEAVYGWFSEDFDTPDLQEAEALLIALGGRVERSVGIRYQDNSVAVAKIVDSDHPTLPDSRLRTRDSELPISYLPESSLHKEGEYWTIVFQDVAGRLKDTRGMRYLALLLQHPHEELHALRLVADDIMPEVAQTESRGGITDLVETDENPVTGFSDAGEILDPQARAAYRQRLEDVRAELEAARESNDSDLTDRLQQEVAFLTRELSQAIGLGGRVRKASAPAERARINVTKAIKGVINKIGKRHPALGRHLAQTIRTGMYSSYTPDPHMLTSWRT
jgi:hypothetical protein